MLLLFISFYNALWRTAAQPRLTAKFSSWSRLSFAVRNLQKNGRERFYFQHRTMGTVWIGQYNGDHHPRQLTSHCGVVMYECKTTCLCCSLNFVCGVQGDGWRVWPRDPVTPATEAMPAWSRGLSTLLDLCTKALYVIFFVVFFCMCVSVVYM